MQPLSTLLTVDKTVREPVYLQISNQLMELIKKGTLQAGHRLLSTRELAEQLNIHRKTVVQSYDELLAQGWLESHAGSGTFVATHLPEIKPQLLLKDAINPARTAGFTFKATPHLNKDVVKPQFNLHLDDGFPDARLAPLEELSRAYRSQLLNGNPYLRLGYGDTQGSSWLRQELSSYLNKTRGLKTTPENILIIRGAVMGAYLISTSFLQSGDNVVVTTLSWVGGNMNFMQAGANLIRIKVDEYGMDVDELEQLCKKKTIRMVYVTSHHHYPTTVPLRADRRIQLLRLAEKYGFIVFEDDYDYDFHYQSKPLLPLASADQRGMVLYCGSFTKTVSPAFRVGYMVGSENVIQHLAKLRRIIDRQGDAMLENAMAELLQNGVIQKHLRKSLRLYRERRDVFCELLKNELSDYVQFKVPDGGMAVWTTFDPKVNLVKLAQQASQQLLYISDGVWHHNDDQQANATRLGFASSTPQELQRCIEILSELLKHKQVKSAYLIKQ
ncbi:PLP-dependent aminotransferase family protein [Chitinophaga sp. CF118]|uniref:MocR-like pyridoxine biosynthesis transcription factor PdxR n=1 Tax=Chitinophaga sp. CF118 TaxID=1884367 RepID=UPI000B7F4A0D|nr:PLP-dependent aminotransferase family protein [Chitinophaga sp. CF118]